MSYRRKENKIFFGGGLRTTVLKMKALSKEASKISTRVLCTTGALMLAFVTTLALVSNRPATDAADMNLFFTSSEPFIMIYLDGEAGPKTYTTYIDPTLDGSVSSIQTNVRVVTDQQGYSLYLQASTANMIGQYNSSNILSPLPSATIQNPAQFTQATCNSWGFATPAVAGNDSAAFSASYSVLNSADVSTVSNLFAAVPTAATRIHSSNLQDETRSYFFAACINRGMPADVFTTTVTWTAVASMETPVVNGTIMQTVTNAGCPAEPTMVIDARDGRTYWIQKIGDLCWMLTNLAYAGGGNNTFGDVIPVSTQATTGTADGLTLHATQAIDGNNMPGMGNTNARFAIPTPPTGAPSFTSCAETAPPFTVANCTLPSVGTGAATGAAGAQYGFFYNWCAAMGGPSVNPAACNLTETNQANIDATASICPAGWRLPTGEPTTGEFWLLNNEVNGGSTTTDLGLRNTWLGVYAGALSTAGYFSTVGDWGFYWSSTIASATLARSLLFSSTSVFPATTNNKNFGFSVRCVL